MDNLLRPRLWLSNEDFDRIRRGFSEGEDSLQYEEQIEALRQMPPPDYYIDESDQYELWQREVGDSITSFTFAYKFFQDEKYYNAARSWALKVCGYPCIGRALPDLAMGQQLFGLSIFYDWCYEKLSEEEKILLKNTLIKYGREMYIGATETGYWKDWSLQNHMWIDICGLGSTAIAIYDDLPEAAGWLELSIENYKGIMASLGDDGASHEGVAYWGYGVSWMMKFMDILRRFSGIDLYKGNRWFSKTAEYRLYMSLPQNAQTSSLNIFDFADSARSDPENSSNILYRLAAEYNNGFAQWLADSQKSSGLFSRSNIWLKMVWYDKNVVKTPCNNLPALKSFSDMGFVVSRADWSGDESVIAYKCGAALGKSATELCGKPPYIDLGAGHVHPDNNHFVIFHKEYILRDDGYVFKATGNHNTLLVDGRGQEGGDVMWFLAHSLIKRGAMPHIIKTESHAKYDYFAGEAAEAYYPDLGLSKFMRHILFIKPNIAIVIDDISTDKDRELELRFFPEYDEITELKENKFLILGKENNVIIDCGNLDGGKSMASKKAVTIERSEKKGERLAVSLHKKCKSWRPVTIISWCDKNQLPKTVACKNDGNIYEFLVEGEAYRLDISKNSVEAIVPSLIGIEVNGKLLADFSKDKREYLYDTKGDVKILREEFNKIDICGIPGMAGVTAEVIRPDGKYGKYEIRLGQEQYFVNVIGEELGVAKIPITAISATHYKEGSPPAHILDSNLSTYWAAEGDGISLTVELGGDTEICGFDMALFKGDIRVSYFEVHASGAVGKYESSGKTLLPEYYPLSAKTNRLKFLFFGNTEGKWNSVVDIGVYKKLNE